MKNIFFVCVLFAINLNLQSQNYYWVFFKDKSQTHFNPYAYFDSKAIERRIQLGVSLYDSTDFPLNEHYVQKVSKLSKEIIGETRWFNAIAVEATQEQIIAIEKFTFVKEISPISSEMAMCSNDSNNPDYYQKEQKELVHAQLKRMGGEHFSAAGIDGKGIRIAVFDGGFPDVDTHIAFKHLRDNNLIIKTWNFPLKKEDVYGWNSHGTMTLSCIAGIDGTQKFGLATAAEFLLARTEIGIEPAKEEVWWMQAMEWADKNGANIISSSLGYGDARYNPSDMNGQKSLVSRAANMAASKGILVCNSMGNEGDKKSWKTIVTPADADSVLAVGGIDPMDDNHTYFSSYGPTADGRLKPNVCAYATNCKVAKPSKSNASFDVASGTSFSCPLVAGFAACVWQKHPELTAMELKTAIEKSADFYPYYDYAYGYGVPQAAYFMFPKISVVLKTFEIEVDDTYIIVKPFEVQKGDKIFYHIEQTNGALSTYENIQFTYASDDTLKIYKSYLNKEGVLRIYFKGYVEKFTLNDEDIQAMEDEKMNKKAWTYVPNGFFSDRRGLKSPSTYGVNAIHYVHPYVSWGFIVPSGLSRFIHYGKSQSFNVGVRYKGNIRKWYSMGVSIDYSNSNIHFKCPIIWVFKKDQISMHSLNLEFYQRFRLFPTEGLGFGCYVDLGVFGTWDFANRRIRMYEIPEYNTEVVQTTKLNNALGWGFRGRFGYGIISVYAQTYYSNYYAGLFRDLEIGVQLIVPIGQ